MNSVKEKLADLELVLQSVLSLAAKKKATSSEASIATDIGYTVTIRMGEVESVEFHNNSVLGLAVYFDKCKGFVTTADTDSEALQEAVKAACDIAKFTQTDPCSGLADANLIAKDIPDLQLYHPWGLSIEEAIDKALSCERYAMKIDKNIINSDGVTISSHQSFSAYANSHGFISSVPRTRHSFCCSLIAGNKQIMERDYSYCVSRDAESLLNDNKLAEIAVKRAVKRLGARKLTTRKVPIIFESRVAGSLIGSFMAAISGSNLYRKSSFLVDSLGEKIFPDYFRIYEEPLLIKGLKSSAFDTEGVATRAKDFVQHGVVRNYLLNSYTARKLGMQTTGNSGGIYNLFVEPNDGDLPNLLNKMGTGLLVTELIGHGINLVTGDYSQGAVGFWVESGEIKYPVNEITIAGNLRDMFSHIAAIGKDIYPWSNIQTGSILIENMVVGGD